MRPLLGFVVPVNLHDITFVFFRIYYVKRVCNMAKPYTYRQMNALYYVVLTTLFQLGTQERGLLDVGRTVTTDPAALGIIYMVMSSLSYFLQAFVLYAGSSVVVFESMYAVEGEVDSWFIVYVWFSNIIIRMTLVLFGEIVRKADLICPTCPDLSGIVKVSIVSPFTIFISIYTIYYSVRVRNVCRAASMRT